MTVRATAMQTCDRCLKPFNEKHLKAGEEVPTFKQRGLVVTETKGTNKDPEPEFSVLFSFDDMCPDCRKSADNLLVKLRMDGTAAKKPRKKRGKKAKVDAPKTPEYSENPEDDPAADEGGESDQGTAEKAVETAPENEASSDEGSEETQAAQEAGSPEEAEAPEEESPAENSADDGGGAEAASHDDDGLVEDSSTGDRYDPETGEVKVRGNKNGETGDDLPF